MSGEETRTRVYIIAATPAMRAGLRAMLAGPNLEVIGEAAGVVVAPAADVVVAGAEEAATTARVLSGDGSTALVTLSDDGRLIGLLRELPLRGWAIVPPDAVPEELRAAVQAAAQGLVAIPRAMVDRLSAPRNSLAEPPAEALTAREREVLELLSQGLPNKQIAGQLQISEHTVKFHISSIFTKLGAASRTEAVSIGARQGLITL